MVTQTLPEYTSAFTFIDGQFSHNSKAVKYPTTTAVEGSLNRYYVFAGSSYKNSISDCKVPRDVLCSDTLRLTVALNVALVHGCKLEPFQFKCVRMVHLSRGS